MAVTPQHSQTHSQTFTAGCVGFSVGPKLSNLRVLGHYMANLYVWFGKQT